MIMCPAGLPVAMIFGALTLAFSIKIFRLLDLDMNIVLVSYDRQCCMSFDGFQHVNQVVQVTWIING